MLQLLKNFIKNFSKINFSSHVELCEEDTAAETLVGQTQSRRDATKPQGARRASPNVTSLITSEMRQR